MQERYLPLSFRFFELKTKIQLRRKFAIRLWKKNLRGNLTTIHVQSFETSIHLR